MRGGGGRCQRTVLHLVTSFALLVHTGQNSACRSHDDEKAADDGGRLERNPHSIIFFPPSGHCFAGADRAYLQVAISRELYREIEGLPCSPSCPLNGGMPCESGSICVSSVVVINGVRVDLGWDGVHEGGEDGASWHVALAGLPDGAYDAHVEVLGLEGGDSDAVKFGVDTSGEGCMDLLLNDVHYGHTGWRPSRTTGMRPPPLHTRGDVIANIARGKPVSMSGGPTSSGGENAVDGARDVFSGRPRAEAHAVPGQASAGGGYWLELDLISQEFVRGVDVFVGLVAKQGLSYPPHELSFRPGGAGLTIRLLGEGRVTASPAVRLAWGGHVLSLTGLVGLARYLRLESSDRFEVREVEAWALAPRDPGCAHCHNGECAEGACLCHPDWAGPACDHNLFTTTWYAPLGGADERWGQDWDDALASVHHGQICAGGDARAIEFRYENRGLAATLNYLVGMLGLAHVHGAAMVPDASTRWVYARDGCEGFGCYFEDWSNCSRAGGGRFDVDRSSHAEVFGIVPPRYADRGLFWWKSVLSSFLFRVRGDIGWPEAELLKTRLGWPKGPVVGVHVRKGDSCVTKRELFGGRCLEAQRYLKDVVALLDRYGAVGVFVATDDPAVVEEIRTGVAPHVAVISLALEQERAGTVQDEEATKWIEDRLRDGELDRETAARGAILDITLLAHCHALVLHLSSNLSRLALSLAAARQRRVPPFASVDGPWCYHWQMCCDVQPDGKSTHC